MQLPYDEYRSIYDELGYGDKDGRKHLDLITRFFDCIVRSFWEDMSLDESLGIAGVSDSVQGQRVVELKQSLPDAFNARSGGRKS